MITPERYLAGLRKASNPRMLELLQRWSSHPADLRAHWEDELEWMADTLPRYHGNRDIWLAVKAIRCLARKSQHPALAVWLQIRLRSPNQSGAFDRQTPLGFKVGSRRYIFPAGSRWAWTDYPLLQSEVGAGPAPIRRVRVLSWDGNKYAKIRWGRRDFSLKVGYLYTSPGRVVEVAPIDPATVRICR